MRHVGVDGCRAGWIAINRACERLEYGVFRAMGDVLAAYDDAERIFVDVPIGLPWDGAPVRPCDRLARGLLGKPRMSSVFPVPCRDAVYARSLAEARKVNSAVLGRSLTEQTWGICAKIKQVDALLLEKAPLGAQVREIHPELCFWALAGRKPMRHRKNTVAGRNERLDVISRHEPGAPALLRLALSQTRRTDVQADDVLDAMVAFITAEAQVGRLTCLTGEPSRDQRGLPMEMLYAEPD